jgi:hypothetical protein
MQVVGAPDIGSALRVLDVGAVDATPLFRQQRGPDRPSLGLV